MAFISGSHERLHQQHQAAESNRGGAGFGTFFNLKIDAESYSPRTEYHDGKNLLSVYYEDVILLNNLDKASMYCYYRAGKNNDVLSDYTFGAQTCPVVDYARYVNDQLPKDSQDCWKGGGGGDPRQALLLPVYVPRRTNGGHVHTNKTDASKKSEVLPIYWLQIDCSPGISSHFANYKRLMDLHRQLPGGAHSHMIRVMRTKGVNNENLLFFEPAPYNAQQTNWIQHPMLDLRDRNNLANVNWNDGYHSFVDLLGLLRYKKFINPQTGAPHHHHNKFQEAEAAYEQFKQWGPILKRLEVPQVATEIRQTMQQHYGGGYPQQQPYQPPVQQTVAPQNWTPQAAPPMQQPQQFGGGWTPQAQSQSWEDSIPF